jgi:hypothetical protein
MTIIVRLKGGLGNQMFQYAAGRRLSELHATNLKLDISILPKYARSYELGHLSIHEDFATTQEVAALTGGNEKWLGDLGNRLRQMTVPYYQRSYFSEPHLTPYDPNILRTPREVCLEGFWESEKYFLEISNIIRQEFKIKDPPDSKNKQLAERIVKTESVSIHVRRGDYLQLQDIFGNPTLNYYAKCISIIQEEIQNPNFFVFSDDPQWTSSNLRLDHPTTIVSQNDSKNYEDLRLMSLCKHNIIANSSFSWWAAWLNSNERKLVLAPTPWFTQRDSRDVIPSGWIKIPKV